MEKKLISREKREAIERRARILDRYSIDDVRAGATAILGTPDIGCASNLALILLEKALRKGLRGDLLKVVLERTLPTRLTCMGIPLSVA